MKVLLDLISSFLAVRCSVIVYISVYVGPEHLQRGQFLGPVHIQQTMKVLFCLYPQSSWTVGRDLYFFLASLGQRRASSCFRYGGPELAVKSAWRSKVTLIDRLAAARIFEFHIALRILFLAL